MIPPLPTDIFQQGQLLNNTYEIEGVIGRGGTGEVYVARNQVSGRVVAVKALSRQFSGNEDYVELMRREEQMRDIAHDSVVRYTECSRSDDGHVFLVMDYIDGPSLQEEMQRRPMGPKELLVVGRRVAEGLEAAHKRGIVHRDLSPDNVILRGGDAEKATLIDFGIAKDTAAGARTIVGNDFAGKYEYAAPEQLEGKADARSDLYALGASLLAAFRGRVPFAGATPGEIVRRKRQPLDTADVPAPLRGVVERLSAPEAGDRPGSAAEALRLIDDALEAARGGPARGRPKGRGGRSTDLVAAAVALVVVAGAGGLWWSGSLDALLARQVAEEGGGSEDQPDDTEDPPAETTGEVPPPEDAGEVDPPAEEPPEPVPEATEPPLVEPEEPPVAPPSAPDDQVDPVEVPPEAQPEPEGEPEPSEPPAREGLEPPATPPSDDEVVAPPEPDETAPDEADGTQAPSDEATPPEPETPPPPALPLADPFVLRVGVGDGAAILSGDAPDDAAVVTLRTAVSEAAGVAVPPGGVRLASGVPSTRWVADMAALVRAAAGLEDWLLEAEGREVRVSGVAPDAGARDRIAAELAALAGEGGLALSLELRAGPRLLEAAEVAAALSELSSCGPLLAFDAPDDGWPLGATIQVRGDVASSEEPELVEAALAPVVGDREVAVEARVLNPDLCAVRAALPPLPDGGMAVRLLDGATGEPRPSGVFGVGENPVVDVELPADAQGSLWVVLVDNTGEVYNLVPNIADPESRVAALGDVEGGLRRLRVFHSFQEVMEDNSRLAFRISEGNFGLSEVIALLSDEPLFEIRRPRDESVESFAQGLREAIAANPENLQAMASRILEARP